jgi:chloramphenicol O-acetyltransferase type A
MSSYILDIDNWKRKDHFHFFRQFEEPFFGVTVSIDCTNAYKAAKEKGISFFLYYLYHSLHAANAIEPFRYRIDDNQLIVFDKVNASPTINRPDGTFGFSYIDYYPNPLDFLANARKEIERVQNNTGLVPAVAGENVIHYSSVPWIRFTSLSHARAFSFKDSIPKISFGKMVEEHGRQTMPMSIHAHHALMDGFHVGQYIDLFEEQLNNFQW